jgi:DNA-binding CsgD family transcriptional regulator
MPNGIDTLTDKEKETLRLIVRGHDAKSAARALGLSVHTINERLRDCRRKLSVSSSREAARLLLAAEGGTPELLGDMALGDAGRIMAMADPLASARTGRWGKPGFALITTGVVAMSLILAALLLPASPLNILPASLATATLAASETDTEAAARTAEDFLELVDAGDWAASYAATGAQFRALNTLARWAEVSEKVRPPLGEVVTRDIIANEFVPAPPEGYRLVKFASSYANGSSQVESLSLVWEDGAWKVVGIVIG